MPVPQEARFLGQVPKRQASPLPRFSSGGTTSTQPPPSLRVVYDSSFTTHHGGRSVTIPRMTNLTQIIG